MDERRHVHQLDRDSRRERRRSPRPAAQRKTSSGRSRLPPAASASSPTVGDDARMRRDRALEPLLELVEVRRRARASRGSSRAPAHAPPRVERDDPAGEAAGTRTSPKPVAHQRGELVRAGEAADARRQVRVRRAARQHLAEQRDDPVEPERVERRERPARPRDLEDRRGGRRARARAAARAIAALRGRRRSGRRSRPSPRRTTPSANGSSSRSPRTHSSCGRLAPGALEHPLREVEPGHLRRRACAPRRRGRPSRSTRRARGRPAGRPPRAVFRASAGRARRS